MRSSEGHKNLIPYKKGQSGNPKGRPRKFVCQLKDLGYNKQDINQTIENMMAMTLSELADVYKDENATILEKTIAGAMKKSLERGSLYSIETLISRVHGTPKAEIDLNATANMNISFLSVDPMHDGTTSDNSTS
jgi:hypothetical protein